MANAYELMDKRTASIGQNGSSASRTFYSLVDNLNDNPLTAVQALRCKRGEMHPQYDSLAVADYEIESSGAHPLVHFVTVLYLPAGLSGFAGWLTTVEFGSETEHLVKSLARKTGDLGYANLAPSGEIIGAHFYEENVEGNYEADTSMQTGPVILKQLATKKREGIQRIAPVTTFTLRRSFQTMTMRKIANALAYKAHVNSRPFMVSRNFDGYPAGTIIFASMSIHERIGDAEEIKYPGRGLDDRTTPAQSNLVSDVEIAFKHRADQQLWTPFELIETYTDGRGYESPVRTRQTPQSLLNHWYKIYEQADLYGIMEAFE